MALASAGAKESEIAASIAATDRAALEQSSGQMVCVEGVVRSVGRGAAGDLVFLNLTSEKDGFAAALLPTVHAEAGDPADYMGLRVKVTGLLISHKGTPQIKVARISQIEVQGD